MSLPLGTGYCNLSTAILEGGEVEIVGEFKSKDGKPLDLDNCKFMLREPTAELTEYNFPQDAEVEKLNGSTFRVFWPSRCGGLHSFRFSTASDAVDSLTCASEDSVWIDYSQVMTGARG